VNVRRATAADRAVVHELYREFYDELPPPPAYATLTLEDELKQVDEYLEQHVALVAEDDQGPVGIALAKLRGKHEGYLSDLYVRERARRRGAAKALLAAASTALRERGATHVTLGVDVSNSAARTVYERLGFREHWLHLVAPLDALEERLQETPTGETFGSVHVQTDDVAAVERGVTQYVPRLGRSGGTVVSEARNGWVAVYDELCDREPNLLRRLARELSDRMGAVALSIGIEDGAVVRYVLFDRGRVADEYASLPEYHGPLPPGDVIALRANPTVAARLTGADPAQVRQAAPTGASPSELPPASELLARVAAALRVEGAGHGYAGA
jgi:ribosomal protein S18 acetylase RimI-like enzyme